MEFNQRVEEILVDLYRIEPGFRSEEARLKQLLTELLAVKPEVVLDENFVLGLKRQLLASAREMQAAAPKKSFFGTLALTWAGSLALLLVAVGVGAYLYKNSVIDNGRKEAANNLLASRQEIRTVGASAFGSLRDVQLAVATGRGGGGDAAKDSVSPSVAYGMGGGGGGLSVPEGIINYKYVYKGDDFEVPDAQMDVYKRDKSLPAGLDAASILRNLDFGVLNGERFSNLTVQSLSLAEDKEFGYSIYIGLTDGMISIGQNWTKWPNIGKLCEGQGEACFRQNQMKLADMPEDPEVIAMANAFLREHNISTDSFGEPYVNDYWRTEYARATDKSMVYLPDQVNVVYPLKLNDKEVYDEGGTKSGLNVMVDVRNKRAAGLSELTSQRYQASSYGTETDPEQLVAIAEKGGYHGGYYENGGRTVEVELGTPTLAYLKVWQYTSDITNELLVPALIFPVTGSDDNQPMYRKNVVVPVIKDIIDLDTSRNPSVGPMPMPVQ